MIISSNNTLQLEYSLSICLFKNHSNDLLTSSVNLRAVRKQRLVAGLTIKRPCKHVMEVGCVFCGEGKTFNLLFRWISTFERWTLKQHILRELYRFKCFSNFLFASVLIEGRLISDPTEILQSALNQYWGTHSHSCSL